MQNIFNSHQNDINDIFRLYRYATEHQKKLGSVSWPKFERSMIEREIEEGRQWKLLEGDTIACVWATTFSDPEIWEKKNSDPSVYIHRIAIDPQFRGRHFVGDIVSWAREYAIQQEKKFIRLDTIGNNSRLIKHYTDHGFEFLGMKTLANTEGLPSHYNDGPACLFEIRL